MRNKVQQLKIKGYVEKLTLAQKAALCSGADKWNTEKFDELGIPAIKMADGPHGLRKEVEGAPGVSFRESEPATCFPTASALACSFDRSLTREIGKAIATEASAAGVSVVLGPGVNIKRNPLCGRNFEYFSEDPFLSGELGAASVMGIQEIGVSACVKHYAVNNQETKRMVMNSCVDRRALHEIYLEPFRRVIRSSRPQPMALMTSYNLVNGEYVAESEYLMSDVLRGAFGFDGVTVSDWGAVSDRVAGLCAGLDIEMPGKASGTTRELLEAVKNGKVTEKRLDETVTRILTLANDLEIGRKRVVGVNYQKHRNLARRAAAESAVLLKNDDDILPFTGAAPFAVVGYLARDPRFQGTGSSRINPIKVDTTLEQLDFLGVNYRYAQGCNADGSTNDTLLKEAKEVAAAAGRAVLFLGLPEPFESEGFDREHMALPDGMLKLVDQVCAVCENVVVALMLGAPVELPFINRVKGALCFYLGGQAVGAAAADVVTGKTTPSGKLAESWAKKLSDIPSSANFAVNRKNVQYREGLYVGYRYFDAAGAEPLFAFGHGLSYTTFDYAGFGSDQPVLKDRNARLGLELMITNTGNVAGGEAVQIYIAKKGEPYKQLKEFQKVYLFAGESRLLRFELSRWSFSEYNTEVGDWQVQPGIYTIMAGSSSRDIRASAEVEVAYKGADAMPEYFPAQLAGKLDDKAFGALLGYVPKEPDSRRYTLDSTIGELRRRLIGKIVWGQMEAALAGESENLDEATRISLEKSFQDLPLRAVCAMSGGMLKKKQARAIVAMANRRVFSALYELIKRE